MRSGLVELADFDEIVVEGDECESTGHEEHGG